MTRYRIQPAGVAAVLQATQGEAASLGPMTKPTAGAANAVVAAAAGSTVIATALEAFLADETGLLTAVNRRIGAAVSGAYEATRAYQRGDEAMVQHYQRVASRLGRGS